MPTVDGIGGQRRLRSAAALSGSIAGIVALCGCGEPKQATLAAKASLPTMAAYAPAKTCRAPAVTDPRQLVPDSAEAVFELDVGRVVGSAAFAKIRATLERDVDVAKALGALSSCDLRLPDLDEVVVATGAGDRVLVVVEAKGIGDTTRLQCLSDALRGPDPDPPWRVKSGKCRTELELSGGDARGLVLGPNVVAVTTRAWQRAVRERMGGRGRAALRHGLGWTRGRVDTHDPAWFAVNLDPAGTMGGSLSGISAGMRRVGGSLDLGSGLSASLVAGYDSPSAARAAHAELARVVGQLEAVLPMMGMSTALADSLQVSRSASDVTLELRASIDDLEALLGVIGPGPARSSPSAKPGPERPGI